MKVWFNQSSPYLHQKPNIFLCCNHPHGFQSPEKWMSYGVSSDFRTLDLVAVTARVEGVWFLAEVRTVLGCLTHTSDLR